MFLFVCLIWIIPFVLYRNVYFKPVCCVLIESDAHPLRPKLISVKTTIKGLSQLRGALTSVVVPLGNGLYGYCVYDPSELRFTRYRSSWLCGDVYIFRRNKLGRFRSVDTSDRCLNDILSKLGTV